VRAREIPSPAADAAAAFSAQHGGEALLIKQAGRTLLAAGNVSEPHKLYSGTKAFWILAALHAVQEGVIRLEEKAAATLAEWADDPQKREITVAQLLNFTSGLDPQFQLHGSVGNRNAVALAAPVVARPGSTFIYGPASLQVFDEILRRKLAAHGDTPIRYLERTVLKPLGFGPQRYLTDSAGQPLLATGFRLTAEQWSRIGQVILDRGRPVISPAIFQNCTRGTAANGAFGMALWNNRGAGHVFSRAVDIEDELELKWPRQNWSGVCISRDAPSDLIAAIGSGYQRLFVIPSRELIVVRFGNGARCPDAEFLRISLNA
jgi:CubicO group peptidase (beta-lactamase class C family)